MFLIARAALYEERKSIEWNKGKREREREDSRQSGRSVLITLPPGPREP